MHRSEQWYINQYNRNRPVKDWVHSYKELLKILKQQSYADSKI